MALLKFSREDKNDYSSPLLSNQVEVILPLLAVDTLVCYIQRLKTLYPLQKRLVTH
jgi:hypothetical protein